jgi:endonuclease/exonuclease/phosphatase family metal-dependent hydrolase
MKSARPMHAQPSNWFALLLVAAAFARLPGIAAAQRPSPAPGFHVATWNVENLYDPYDDPANPYDDEFLPNNPTTRWTRARFETKLDNLAQVLSGMNRGQGPDLLALQEVENESVVQALAARLGSKPYAVVHLDSPDRRGIDVALLYNRDLFSLRARRALPIRIGRNRHSRDVLQAILADRQGALLHVFVNHWPSRGGGSAATDADRFVAAKTLSRAIDSLFRIAPAARILALGDFNDEPHSPSIRLVLDAAPYPSKDGYSPGRLYNLSSPTSARGFGTYFHSFRGAVHWRMYDQIIVSGSLLEGNRIEYDEGTFRIDRPAYMLVDGGRRKGAPTPTFRNRDVYQGGYSDHLPVGARFERPAP